VYCEDYAGYFTVILPFLAFYFCSAYFIYLVSCISNDKDTKNSIQARLKEDETIHELKDLMENEK
jgi:hypothetical protein